MARSRIIKPEFFLNEILVTLPPLTRLLFIGLWQQADRDGLLEDRPTRLKMGILPADDCDVDAMLRELHDTGFIVRYTVDQSGYIAIPAFAKHQSPHISEKSRGFHGPDLATKKPVEASDESGAGTIQAPDKHDAGTIQARIFPPHSDSDSDSGSGSGSDERESPSATPAPRLEWLTERWNAIPGVVHVRSATEKRRQAFRARSHDKAWLANLDEALGRVARSEFLSGANDRNWRADIDWFLRPDTVTKIIEGKYDSGGTPDRKGNNGHQTARVRQRDYSQFDNAGAAGRERQ